VTVIATVRDPQQLRRVFGSFPSGVAAVAALVAGEPVGIAASSFTSVSLDPPLVSVCIAHTSTTWPVLRTASRLGVSIGPLVYYASQFHRLEQGEQS
jgi:flavin reductase (DIM6/NTAB) family NADH-FMN oxidoreductase RutF